MNKYFLNPNILYRKEQFGAVVFNKLSRQYFLFDTTAYSLLSIIKENQGLSIEELSQYVEEALIPEIIHLLDDWKKHEILSCEFYSIKHQERPSVSCHITKDMLSFPLKVAINPTFLCNQKCLFCSNESIINKEIKELSEEEIDKLTSRLFELGVFKTYFVGGEPFLFKPLRFFIEKLLFYNFDIGITTNGNFENKDDLLFFAQKGVFISFSVQSHIESVHNGLTQNSISFNQAISNIKFLADHRLPVDISIILSSENQENIEETINYFCDLGVKSITLLYPFNIGGVCNHNELLIPKRQFFCYAERLVELARRKGVTLKPLGRMRFFYDQNYELDKQKHDLMFKKYLGTPGCFLCKKAMVLHPNGDIYPCDFLMFEEKWKIGNIFDKAIVDTWENSSLVNSLRFLPLPQSCMDCEYFDVCQGGCPAQLAILKQEYYPILLQIALKNRLIKYDNA